MMLTQIDPGVYRALQCRVNRIRAAAPRLNSRSEEKTREARRIILGQLYETRVLCQTFDIDFLEYLKEKDIILVDKPDGRVDVHIA